MPKNTQKVLVDPIKNRVNKDSLFEKLDAFRDTKITITITERVSKRIFVQKVVWHRLKEPVHRKSYSL